MMKEYDIKIPTSWDEITLKQFQELQSFYGDEEKKFDAREVLHILTNLSIDEVNELPYEVSEVLLEKLSFIATEPNIGEPTNKIEYNGETYVINTQEKLKTGEYLAYETSIKGDKNDYASILAILCRKEGEVYDQRFENEMYEQRKNMFLEVPMVKVMPTISFFLKLWIMFNVPSQLSSHLKELISQERNNIETLHKNGELGRRTMKSVMKTLNKFEKTINGI